MRPSTRLLAVLISLGALGACGHDGTPIDPNAPDELLFQEGLAAYDAMDYPTAITKFDELLVTYPKSVRHDNAGYLIGRSDYSLNDFPAGIAAMTDMLSLHPDSTFAGNALYFRGRSRFRLAGQATPGDSYAAALVDFEDSLVTDPGATYADNASYYVGRTHYQQGNFDLAITALAATQVDYPGSSYHDDAQYYTGRSYFDLAQFADSVAAFDLVLQDASSSLKDNARYRRGRANYEIPDFAAALLDFEDVSASFAGSIFEDNSLYYRIRVYVDQASCVEASSVLATMQADFSGSGYISRAQAYMTGGGC